MADSSLLISDLELQPAAGDVGTEDDEFDPIPVTGRKNSQGRFYLFYFIFCSVSMRAAVSQSDVSNLGITNSCSHTLKKLVCSICVFSVVYDTSNY